jgi:hypothetical protein
MLYELAARVVIALARFADKMVCAFAQVTGGDDEDL